MPGPGIVPAVRTFLNGFVGQFVEPNAEIRLNTFEHGSKRRGHDAAADQNDVGIVDVCLLERLSVSLGLMQSRSDHADKVVVVSAVLFVPKGNSHFDSLAK